MHNHNYYITEASLQ